MLNLNIIERINSLNQTLFITYVYLYGIIWLFEFLTFLLHYLTRENPSPAVTCYHLHLVIQTLLSQSIFRPLPGPVYSSIIYAKLL